MPPCSLFLGVLLPEFFEDLILQSYRFFVQCELPFPRVYCNYEFVFSAVNCVEISWACLRMCSSKDILP